MPGSVSLHPGVYPNCPEIPLEACCQVELTLRRISMADSGYCHMSTESLTSPSELRSGIGIFLQHEYAA